MSRSFHPPRSKNRCNRKRLEQLPLGERRDELLPRIQVYYTRLCALPRRTRRALVRQWRRSLFAIALLLALGQAPALAATIAVAPGIPPDINADGICALIEAIDNANADAQTHSDCVAGEGADTIKLPTGSTQSLTAVDNTSLGPTGLPVISSTVTIRGRNSTIRRESDALEFRILAVASSGDLTLHRTTVSGGVNGYSYLYPNGGGGVYNSGMLTLTKSTVSGNSAFFGGGGVSNSGTTTLMNSTVSGNFGDYGAGGVDNTGNLTLTNSTVSGNRINYVADGGGVSNSGTLTLTNSTVSGNSGTGGGGVFNSGALTVTNSTVSGNSLPGFCGRCSNTGGGVFNIGTLTLTNSTVSGNSVVFPGAGGGVYNSGTLTLARTLISGNNYSFYSGGSSEVEGGGTIVANNYNLFGHDGDAGVVGFSPGLTDIVPNVPLSAILNTTLANNGGPTRTHALVRGSPAIDASPDDADCAATDQRGVRRPRGPACDIGAFEARKRQRHRFW